MGIRTRTFLAALAISVALPAHAVGRWTDATDLWWNSSQSGWGVNVIQQNDVLVLTFFVYGPNLNPVWYSADARLEGTSNGVLVATGALYETHGPWLADNFFDPARVIHRQVGTVTFRLNSIGSATLTYTVDGLTIQKQLTRFTFRVNELAGSYLGAIAGDYSGCASSFSNGYAEEGGLRYVITQTSTNVAIQATSNSATCVYSGTYVQEGRIFEASEIEANPQTFSAKVTTETNVCNFSGRIGGLRRSN
jgi:hypothetical protein